MLGVCSRNNPSRKENKNVKIGPACRQAGAPHFMYLQMKNATAQSNLNTIPIMGIENK